jgi:GTP cyclohydrolase I
MSYGPVPESEVRDCIMKLLWAIGDDPSREGLLETPARVARSFKELFVGYTQDAADVMKVFEDGACDEMVLLKGIEFCSTCEHHMLPFLGVAHVAYLPNTRIIGISKLARLVEVYSRRLQVQERLTTQVTQALDQHLAPRGSACVIEAQHLCMACRGVRKQSSVMVTSSLTGAFKKAEVRAEFFNLIKG